MASFDPSVFNPLMAGTQQPGPLDAVFKMAQLQQLVGQNQLMQEAEVAKSRLSEFAQANTPEGGQLDMTGFFRDMMLDERMAPYAPQFMQQVAQADSARGAAIEQGLVNEQRRLQMIGDTMAPLLDKPEITNADLTDAAASLMASWQSAGLEFDEDQIIDQLINMPSDAVGRRETVANFAQRAQGAAETIKQQLGDFASVNNSLYHVRSNLTGEPEVKLVGGQPIGEAQPGALGNMSSTQLGRYYALVEGFEQSGISPDEAHRRALLEVGGAVYTGVDSQTNLPRIFSLTGEEFPMAIGPGAPIPGAANAELPEQLSAEDTQFVAAMMPAYEDFLQRWGNVARDLTAEFGSLEDVTPEARQQLMMMRQDFMEENGLAEGDMQVLERQQQLAQRDNEVMQEEANMNASADEEDFIYNPAYAQAFGLSGGIRGAVNTVSGALNPNPMFPDVQRIQSQIRTRGVAARDFWRSLAEGRELAAFENRINAIDINPDKWLQSPSQARDSITAMVDLMEEMTAENERIASSAPVGSAARQDAEQNLIRMESDLNYWTNVKRQLDRATVPAPQESGAAAYDTRNRRN